MPSFYTPYNHPRPVAKYTMELFEHTTTSALLSYAALITVAVSVFVATRTSKNKLPLMNGERLFSVNAANVAKKRFMVGAREILAQGLQHAANKPFRVVADVGEVIILPSHYAQEIRNHDDMSMTQAAFKWFYAHLPGFEGFREGTTESQIIKLVARHQLTQQLTLVTGAVSNECAAALQDVYTDNDQWHDIPAKACNLEVMARITSRVFLGEELCRNPDWLRVTTTYTVVAFSAVEELRLWPGWLRSTVQWYLPHCKAARSLVLEARRIIQPLLVKRRMEKIEAAKLGQKVLYNDAIEWLETTASERGLSYDTTCAQLSLSVAALHSTTDFFTQAVLDIAVHSEIIEPLRAEIRSVIGDGGWNKHSLYHLKLMDSVLKESQRLKPIAIASMRRLTTADVELSDGVVLPKGSLTLVSADKHWDPVAYPDPLLWNGYRFLNLRKEAGKENMSQLVSATAEHFGFGYGLHACPGRFFASEEIKIALVHMLMKYDIELVPDSEISPRKYGFSLTANSTAQLRIRRRTESFAE